MRWNEREIQPEKDEKKKEDKPKEKPLSLIHI